MSQGNLSHALGYNWVVQIRGGFHNQANTMCLFFFFLSLNYQLVDIYKGRILGWSGNSYPLMGLPTITTLQIAVLEMSPKQAPNECPTTCLLSGISIGFPKSMKVTGAALIAPHFVKDLTGNNENKLKKTHCKKYILSCKLWWFNIQEMGRTNGQWSLIKSSSQTKRARKGTEATRNWRTELKNSSH